MEQRAASMVRSRLVRLVLVLIQLLSIQVDGTKHNKSERTGLPLTKKLRTVDRPREFAVDMERQTAPSLLQADDGAGETKAYGQLGEFRGPKLEKEEQDEDKDVLERVIKHDSRCSIIGRSREGDWYSTDCGDTNHHGDKASKEQLPIDSLKGGVYHFGDSIDPSKLRNGLPTPSPPQPHGDGDADDPPSESSAKEKGYTDKSKRYGDRSDFRDKTSKEQHHASTIGGVYHFGGIDPAQLRHSLPAPSANPRKEHFDNDEPKDELADSIETGKGSSEGVRYVDHHGGTRGKVAGLQHHEIITPYQEMYLNQERAQSSGGKGGKGGKGDKSSGKGKSNGKGKSSGKGKISSKSGKGKKYEASEKKSKKHGKKKGGKGKGERYHYAHAEFDVTTDHPTTTYVPYPQPSPRPGPRPTLRPRPITRPSFGPKQSDGPVIVDPPPRKPNIPFTPAPTPKRQDDVSLRPVRVRRQTKNVQRTHTKCVTQSTVFPTSSGTFTSLPTTSSPTSASSSPTPESIPTESPVTAPTFSPTSPPTTSSQAPTKGATQAPTLAPTSLVVSDAPMVGPETSRPTQPPVSNSPSIGPTTDSISRFPSIAPADVSISHFPTTAPMEDSTSRFPSIAPMKDSNSSFPTIAPSGIAPSAAPTESSIDGIVVPVTRFEVDYKTTGTVSEQQFGEAEDVTLEYLRKFMEQQFSYNAMTDLIEFRGTLVEKDNGATVATYDVTLIFSEESIGTPSTEEADLLVFAAFNQPFVPELIKQLQALSAQNPFSQTTDVTYNPLQKRRWLAITST